MTDDPCTNRQINKDEPVRYVVNRVTHEFEVEEEDEGFWDDWDWGQHDDWGDRDD